MITQERLKDLFIYDPETGIFTSKCKKQTHNKKTTHGWIQKGYWAIKIDGVKYLCHRLAFLYMTGSMPVDCVDHINRDRSDNRWENLRDCSPAENRKNHPINKRNTTGVSGVSFRKERNAWIVIIKKKYIGYFKDLSEAMAARDSACTLMGFHKNHGKTL